MTIGSFLKANTARLERADIATARLDILVLLEDELGQDKSWVLSHDDHELGPQVIEELDAQISQREKRVPLAYIRGVKEFYGREFVVNPDVLIPRPDTEELIEQLKLLKPEPGQRLIDVGTGSGAIAVTAVLEFPGLQVTACDISADALEVASENAVIYSAPVTFFRSNLLEDTKETYDFIAANLPYVDSIWERSVETDYEPHVALFAENEGLALINDLLMQTPAHLEDAGCVLLEADPRQHDAIIKTGAIHGLQFVAAKDFIVVLRKA
jgi:release factor glutamine methyltransferase